MKPEIKFFGEPKHPTWFSYYHSSAFEYIAKCLKTSKPLLEWRYNMNLIQTNW